MKIFQGTLSKSGLPVLCEKGGGMSNTGYAVLIASPSYKKMKPIHLFTGGHLSNGNHAVFAVRLGMKISEVSRSGNDLSLKLWEVTEITINENKYDCEITCKEINSFDMGEWDTVLDSKALFFVSASFDKVNDYHCRTAFWAEGDR